MRINIDGVVGEISTLPGSSQCAVSHFVYTREGNRGKGLGSSVMSKRLDIVFNELGYDYLLCTVAEGNDAQTKILDKAGWRFLDRYTSSKTGNTVLIYGISRNKELP